MTVVGVRVWMVTQPMSWPAQGGTLRALNLSAGANPINIHKSPLHPMADQCLNFKISSKRPAILSLIMQPMTTLTFFKVCKV